MAISYDTIHQSPLAGRVSSALDDLRSINEQYQAEGINVLNEGFSEVATNAHYFEDYVAKLSEGMDPQTAEEFRVMAGNVRTQTLQESSISGINPVTALSLPMLRVAYPKTAIREGLPTEPVLQPKFKVTWLKPYIVDSADNSKVYLPAGIKSRKNLFKLQPLSVAPIAANPKIIHIL